MNPYSKKNKNDGTFLIIFLFIFALCFTPLILKTLRDSNAETEPTIAYKNNLESENNSQNTQELSTVVRKPVIEFQYSENNTIDDMSIIQSEAVLLYDKKTNTIICKKNSEKALFPASTTKIMTAYVALKYLPENYNLKVGSELSLLQPESSLAYLKEGSTISLEDALYALLLPSGNDAAYVIAVNTARYVSERIMTDKEAVNYFCTLMNRAAADAGALRTNFCNPDGYHDPFHYTTAEDLLRIAIKTTEYPLIAEIASAPFRETKIVSGEDYYWINGNCLVVNDNRYYLPFAKGLKTGFTDEAGYCMVATASDNDNDLIAIVMKAPSLAGRYTDAAKLFYSVIDPQKLIVTEPAETTISEIENDCS